MDLILKHIPELDAQVQRLFELGQGKRYLVTVPATFSAEQCHQLMMWLNTYELDCIVLPEPIKLYEIQHPQPEQR